MKTVSLGENVKAEVREIECKRFYLPLELKSACPLCGEENLVSLEENYLSYPSTEGLETVFTCCDSCEGEYELVVELTMFLKFIGIRE